MNGIGHASKDIGLTWWLLRKALMVSVELFGQRKGGSVRQRHVTPVGSFRGFLTTPTPGPPSVIAAPT